MLNDQLVVVLDENLKVLEICEAWNFVKLNTSFLDLVHPEDEDSIQLSFQKFEKTKIRLRHRDGEFYWFELTGKKTDCILLSAKNIHEYQTKILQQEKKDEMFQAIVENIPLMLSFYGKEGEFEWVNSGWVNDLGWDISSMRGQNMLEKFYPDEKVRKQVLDFMLSGKSGWQSFNLKTKSGKNLQTSWANVRLSSGQSIGIGKNIEKEYALEQNLKKSNRELQVFKERLELAIKALGLAVWDWDVKSGHVYWDNRMYEIYEVDRHEFNHDIEYIFRFMASSEIDKIRNSIQDVIKNKQSESKVEFLITTKSGKQKIILGSALYFYDDNGEVERVVGNNWDVTEIRQLEAKSYHSAQMASLGLMAGGMAHEINNPLAIIKAKSDLLKKLIEKEPLPKEKLSTGLDQISDTVDRIARIVKGLRSFSRDTKEDESEVVDISVVIDDVIGMCREKFKNSGVEILLEIQRGTELNCRPIQVGQVLLNLLNNSFDAIETQQQKWVKVKCLMLNSKVIIEVIDSGQGLPLDVVNKMMQPFFTTKEIGKGTGLGLSISKGIVEDHGGQLYYDSSSSNTKFVIELPNNIKD